jgi:hypothetical protein
MERDNSEGTCPIVALRTGRDPVDIKFRILATRLVERLCLLLLAVSRCSLLKATRTSCTDTPADIIVIVSFDPYCSRSNGL